MINYIMSNQLNIDKNTYITVVIGQIAIYGILMTFYQFVASFEGSVGLGNKYLGINLIEYLIKQKVSMFHLVISRWYFCILFILEVLYKPIISLYGEMFSSKMICIFNFLWYSFVVFYFLIFIIFCLQCTKSTLEVKNIYSTKIKMEIIDDINKKFVKILMRESKKNRMVDVLYSAMKQIGFYIKQDKNPEWIQEGYNNLIVLIFDCYISKKQKEINEIVKKNMNEQKEWIYESRIENIILKEIFDKKYYNVYKKLNKYICEIHLELIKLTMQMEVLDGINNINTYYQAYQFNRLNNQESCFDCSEWERFTIHIFKNVNFELRKYLIDNLSKGYFSENILFKKYCEICMFNLINMSTNQVFYGEISKEEFVENFSVIKEIDNFNDYYANVLCDKLISYNNFEASCLVKLLNKQNSLYIFVYIIIYYSIYKRRDDWKYINIDVMRELWINQEDTNINENKIIEQIKGSNISHRFSEEMYYKLIEYIRNTLNGSLLNSIFNEKIIDVFYITIIKLCVLDEVYIDYVNKSDNEMAIYFINEISKHPELIKYDNVIRMILCIQHKYFSKLDQIPRKLKISLRSLLLSNINLEVLLVEDMHGSSYSIGEYILIKLIETKVLKTRRKTLNKLIRKSYLEKNMSVDAYIDLLDKECGLCGCDLNYVQKKKMKRYLLNII